MWRTVEELEDEFGSQIRGVRLSRNATVEQVAERAGVSPKTVQNLEAGRGSSLTTLVKVLRALDKEAWLTTLDDPTQIVSPMALLEGNNPRTRRRASGPRRG